MPMFCIDLELNIESFFLRSPYGLAKLYLSEILLYLNVLPFVRVLVLVSDEIKCYLLSFKGCLECFLFENVTSNLRTVDPA